MKKNNWEELEKLGQDFPKLTPAEQEKLQNDLMKIARDSDTSEAEKANALLANLRKNLVSNKPIILPKLRDSDITARSNESTDFGNQITALLDQADDKYYAAEYNDAVEIYKRVLSISPDNTQALEQIKKAELLRSDEKITATIPRDSIQAYRRARSHVNAGDVNGAASLLEMALNIAENANVSFPQAQALYESLQDAIIAAEYRHKAENALNVRDWADAIRQLNYAIRLDPTDSIAKPLLRQIEELCSILDRLSLLEKAPGNLVEQSTSYVDIRRSLENAEHSIATEELFNEIAERTQLLSQRIGEQLAKQADALLNQAERAVLLKTKSEKFGEAEKIYKQVEQISSGLVNRSKQARAENQGEISRRYYERIKELKTAELWTPDGLPYEEIQLWGSFSPDDPDVRQALDMVQDTEIRKRKQKQDAETAGQTRRILTTIGLSVLSIVIFIAFVFFIAFLYGQVQASLVPTATPIPSPTEIPTATPTLTPSPVVFPTLTETPFPSATPFPLGITTLPAGTYDSPNGNQIGNIGSSQVVTVLNRKEVGADIWYFCKWEINGVKNEGWIRNRVQIVSNPSP